MEQQEPHFDEAGFAKLQTELREEDAKFNTTARGVMLASSLRILEQLEEKEPGPERRREAAGGLLMFMQACPVIWESIAEGNPDMPPTARAEMVLRMLEVVFEVQLDTLAAVTLVP